MGENGEQGKNRVTQTVLENLPKLETLPVWHGQINVRKLATKCKIPFKNFYENEDIIKAVNKRAKKENLPPLPTIEEREKLAEENPGEMQTGTKSADIVTLERTIRSLENRITAANNLTRDLESENKRLKAENERLKRQSFCDEMAMNGRPARDSAREVQ